MEIIAYNQQMAHNNCNLPVPVPYLSDQKKDLDMNVSGPIFLVSAGQVPGDSSRDETIVECVCQALSSFQFSMIALIGSRQGSLTPPHFQTSQHNISVKRKIYSI